MDNRTKLVAEWMKKAENDLRNAKAVIQVKEPPTDTVCFHSQQCAEKYLKAFLIYYKIEFEKQHDLHYLLDLCERIEPSFNDLRKVADVLNPYAVEIRYPDDFYEYSTAEAKKAINLAQKVKVFVLEKLG